MTLLSTLKAPTPAAPVKFSPKLLSADELNVYNRLLEMKHNLVELKKTTTYSFPEIANYAEKCGQIYLDFIQSCDQDSWKGWNSLTSKYIESLFDEIHYIILDCYIYLDKIAPELSKVYNQLITITKGLNELAQLNAFTVEDIHKYQVRLREIENEHFKDGAFRLKDDKVVPKGQAVLSSKLNRAYKVAERLLIESENIASELEPVHQELVEIYHKLSSPNSTNLTIPELQILQASLRSIDSKRQNGSFVSADGTILPGQAVLIGTLESAYERISALTVKKDEVDESLSSVFNELCGVKAKLEEMLNNRWNVTWGDLAPFHRTLLKIEESRDNGIFGKPVNGNIPKGQGVLHTLFHQCHRTLYRLQCTLEPIHPALETLQYDLLSIRKILMLLQRMNNVSHEELNQIGKTLNCYDDLRRDGEFQMDGEKLPGQAALHSLLNECYDLLFDLKYSCEFGSY
ncbi:hypothetical protein BKA69DRAFT_1055752 [Paraphysoderma sedebokerense]|nr:hypothetical protein BKA69DRAFT_1055752 [Paraphysoderma sedebokerense]